MTHFRIHSIIALLLLLLVLPATPLAAQPDGIKKSKKTEVIDGKKYYLHTVEKGQTLFGIARAYGLTTNDVLVENPDLINGSIKPGMVLRIPVEKPLPPVKPNQPVQTQTQTAAKDTSTFLYTVEAGQTLYSIAQQNKTTVEVLQQLNPELKTAPLRAGQQIRVPGKAQPQNITSLPANVSLTDTTFRENKKTLYNVVLMLPLQLAQVDNIDPENADKGAGFSAKAQAAIEFYEGALLAVDSMKRRGMKVKLHVFDIGIADSLNVEKTLLKPELQQADLILGPLDPEPFVKVAEFGRKKNIAVVSPLAASNKVLFKQPTSGKVVPSLSTQLEQLAVYLQTSATNDQIILINSGNPKEQQMVKTFRSKSDELRIKAGKDSIIYMTGSAGIEAKLKKGEKNIIVVPSTSQAFVTGLLLTLKGLAEKYTIEVYGMPKWMEYGNLDKEYMQSVNLHFVSHYFIDYEDPATKRLLLQYRAVFKGDAGPYVFAGFDVTLFFLNALFTEGTLFYMKLGTIKGDGLQQRFEFYRSEEESGFDNKGIRIVKMEDYKLVRKL
ncbi:MAG: LysM peptidoglycan-binding domain-containing protein [Bacteroidia bacterium]|nr:LysM peptidoglycan-binding domain-containing protein [Bacteroidia bacterium]